MRVYNVRVAPLLFCVWNRAWRAGRAPSEEVHGSWAHARCWRRETEDRTAKQKRREAQQHFFARPPAIMVQPQHAGVRAHAPPLARSCLSNLMLYCRIMTSALLPGNRSYDSYVLCHLETTTEQGGNMYLLLFNFALFIADRNGAKIHRTFQEVGFQGNAERGETTEVSSTSCNRPPLPADRRWSRTRGAKTERVSLPS